MNDIPVSRICGYLLFVLFLLVPLFELRSINYSFFGERSISPALIFYLLCALILVIKRGDYRNEQEPEEKLKIIRYLIFGSLMLFLVAWELLAGEKTVGASTFTLAGMTALFITVQVLFREYGPKIWVQIPSLVMFMAVIYAAFAIVFLYFINGTELTGNIDVVTSADFAFSVRPYQLATIATFAALLGTAVCIGSKQEFYVYWIGPLLGYVVSLTASRSGFVGFWILWVILCVWIARERVKVAGRRQAQVLAAKLIVAAAVSLIAITELLPKTNLFERYSDTNLKIPLPVDHVREQLWRIALKSGPASGQEPIIGVTNFGSFHNAFLDIYVSSGYPALLFFVAFIVIIAIGLLQALNLSTSMRDRTIRFALFLCFVQLMFQALINPILSFSAAWLMLGTFAASLGSLRLVKDDRKWHQTYLRKRMET